MNYIFFNFLGLLLEVLFIFHLNAWWNYIAKYKLASNSRDLYVEKGEYSLNATDKLYIADKGNISWTLMNQKCPRNKILRKYYAVDHTP